MEKADWHKTNPNDLGLIVNKTDGYHREVLRLPIFVKEAFENMKLFNSWETLLLHLFSSFSKF